MTSPSSSASSPSPDARSSVPSVVIIGNDALVAALPATAVQLALACMEAGYDHVVPASWGDELIAAESLRRLAAHSESPSILCSCPHVRARLLASGTDLAPSLVALVAPPVAAARYVRALFRNELVRITYVGDCPSAADASIDARFTPAEFLDHLRDRGIALARQPKYFDSVVPPDRRRFFSLPGGFPSPELLLQQCGMNAVVEFEGDDLSADVAQHLISGERALIDLAPRLGCACGGVMPTVPAASAREAVTSLEPPRSPAPVIDVSVRVALDQSIVPPTSPAPPVSVGVPSSGDASAEARWAPAISEPQRAASTTPEPQPVPRIRPRPADLLALTALPGAEMTFSSIAQAEQAMLAASRRAAVATDPSAHPSAAGETERQIAVAIEPAPHTNGAAPPAAEPSPDDTAPGTSSELSSVASIADNVRAGRYSDRAIRRAHDVLAETVWAGDDTEGIQRYIPWLFLALLGALIALVAYEITGRG